MKRVAVFDGDASYQVHIGANLLQQAWPTMSTFIPEGQVLILSDDHVAPLYLESLKRKVHIVAHQVDTFVMPHGEMHKTLEQFQLIIDFLIQKGHTRDTLIITLGGGVVGDIGGYVASSYMRGVNWLNIPTSLMAQVDAAVGGKTAVNHPLGKNLIGAFHQPCAVFVDVEYLQSLAQKEFLSALSEVIKYALVKDVSFFNWLLAAKEAILAQDQQALEHMIYHCIEHKSALVYGDEKDQKGSRVLLNFGHTFAHAIESLSGYRINHGQAVAIGIMLAVEFSVYAGFLASDLWQDELREFFDFFQLLSALPKDISVPQLIDAMGRDKKNSGKKIHLVLLKSLGEGFWHQEDSAALLEQFLQEHIGACV